jgi:hypothetical protein
MRTPSGSRLTVLRAFSGRGCVAELDRPLAKRTLGIGRCDKNGMIGCRILDIEMKMSGGCDRAGSRTRHRNR